MANTDPSRRPRPGPWPPIQEPPSSSWAKKTGFKPKLSGETNVSDSGQIVAAKSKPLDVQVDLESGRRQEAPVINGELESEKKMAAPSDRDQTAKKRKDLEGAAPKNTVLGPNGQQARVGNSVSHPKPSHEDIVNVLPQSIDDDGFGNRQSHMKYELRDTPGLGGFYSIIRSAVFRKT